MAYPSDGADDTPPVDLPAGPRPPSIYLVTSLAVSGLVLLLAPFAFAMTARHPPRHDTPGATANVSESLAATSPVTFRATAGPGCPTARAASYHRVGTFFNERVGWLHFGNGCVGQTDSMPLSGDADTPNATLYAEWDFHTDPVSRGSCLVEVYVSGVGDIVYNGGDPAHYVVYGSIEGGDPVQTFTIVQLAHIASWVTVGSIPVTHGELRIVATNEGVNLVDKVPTYRHISTGAVKVTCSLTPPSFQWKTLLHNSYR